MKNDVYVSSKRQKKYLKKVPSLEFVSNPNVEWKVMNIFPTMKYQRIIGFGSALTEASAINYSLLSDSARKRFVTAMFDRKNGAGMNLCRTVINSCDFSASEYTYVTDDDKALGSFSLEHEDECVIPLLQTAADGCTDRMIYFASPWSPPAFMKDNGSVIHGGQLLPEYYQSWADYFVRYVQECKKRGVNIDAVTVQNESFASQTWESCYYSPEQQILFVRDYLYPAFRAAGLDTEIMIWDHNKEHVPDWVIAMNSIDGAAECVNGIAFHSYSGDHFDALRIAHELAPDKAVVATEFCRGGSDYNWRDAAYYAHDMIGNLNNYCAGVTDWNIMLDKKGGPYHYRVGACKASAQFDPDSCDFTLTPVYYAISHFSKYIMRGAYRLGISAFSKNIQLCAFENPDGSIVAVIQNELLKKCGVTLKIGEYAAPCELPPDSLTTVVIHK